MPAGTAPLVSIVIIFWNTRQFIGEAVESVFAQTYDRWELLLVDDGSTDGSSQIARCYAEQHPEKVIYLNHAGHLNRGMSASRNLGIHSARGKYITFLDADDVWFPEALKEQVAILEAHPEAGMVYGPVQRWHSWNGNPGIQPPDSVEELGVELDSLIQSPNILTHFLRDEGTKPSGFMLRRELAIKIGGYEESFRGMYEDQVFCAKVCMEEPVFVASACWYRYRKHPDSCCSITVSSGGYRSARRVFLDWLNKYMAERGIRDRQVWSALREEMWRNNHPFLYNLWIRAYPLTRLVKESLIAILRFALPAPARRWLVERWSRRAGQMPIGGVRYGDLRSVVPISREWGYDRGLPIDRYYIDRFLSTHAEDIQGRVLEIGDDVYTRRFGGDRVICSDVLNVMAGKPRTTIVADLTRPNQIPSARFDCIIFTQTLPFIYEISTAISTLNRILAPGGILLATFAGISKLSRSDAQRWGHYWAFTSLSARRLFEEAFPESELQVGTFGNVLTAIAFLHGLAAQELRPEELETHDPEYELLITVRAAKSGEIQG